MLLGLLQPLRKVRVARQQLFVAGSGDVVHQPRLQGAIEIVCLDPGEQLRGVGRDAMASAVLEGRRAALQEGTGAFTHVLGGEQQAELRTFVFQPGLQAALAAHVHRVEQATQGQRR